VLIDVAILGAGPYGLSVASHLRARGIGFRIFGRPMQSWRAHMPIGMHLKSEGFATNLSDPSASFTLKRFCIDRGLPYDSGTAIPLDWFLAYGLAFQKRFVPEIEERSVLSVKRSANGFDLAFEDGEVLAARRLLVAVGVHPFRDMPAPLTLLPRELASHSADHAELKGFGCRDITIVGGGSSAVELGALLHESGANVRLVTRRSGALQYQPRPIVRPLWRRAVRPLSGIGYGWHSLLITEAPQLFRLFPPQQRLWGVNHYLMPAAGWFVRDRFQDRVAHLSGYALESAVAAGSQVQLQLRHVAGQQLLLKTDHVIAATGYRLDLDRLPILDEDLRRDVRRVGGTPRLSANFESSVPGLYFLGPLSANCFGPAMRFVLGADFTARRLARHLASTIRESASSASIRRL
jgi:Pyridine nucleotide-disulphide oxidoreductase